MTFISFIILFKSPYIASNLDVIPDSEEYAIGGNRIVTHGSYTIIINGMELPPRYPPWFSLFVMAPTYFIMGTEVGNAIYAITLFGILGISAAFCIGRKISGEWGGVFAALGLFLIPGYTEMGRQIMTDIPCASLILLLCLIYIHLRSSSSSKLYFYALAGIFIGLCSAFRQVCLLTAIPFLIITLSAGRIPQMGIRATLLLAPSAIIVWATLVYNFYTFGSFFRTGYNFWCSFPYDYFSRVFSSKFILQNANPFFRSIAPGILLGSFVLVLHKSKAITCNFSTISKLYLKSILQFMALGIAPIVIIYLFYFFPAKRFYYPCASLFMVMIGSILSTCIKDNYRNLLICVLIILLLIISFMAFNRNETPFKRITVDRILSNTPDNAIIISPIDPGYLEFFLSKKSGRLSIPLSRRVEYADKLVKNPVIQNPPPPPKDWRDHGCLGPLEGIWRKTVPYVVTDDPEILVDKARKGAPIYLDTNNIGEKDYAIVRVLSKKFEFIKEADHLFKLKFNN